MSNDDIAAAVLECVGGFSNIAGNSLCATRLRITLKDRSAVERNALHSINGVLGLADRGTNGIEVVFGPNLVRGVYRAFRQLVGPSRDNADEATDDEPSRPAEKFRVKITPEIPGQPRVDRTLKSTPAVKTDDEDTNALLDLLHNGMPTSRDDAPEEEVAEEPANTGIPRLLVVNGPNLNMLGIGVWQEKYKLPEYAYLLDLCRSTALDAGFAICECYQSNHLGDLIDQIQDACNDYDALVINPSTYDDARALRDAVLIAGLPTIEVRLILRDDTPQPSCVSQACLYSITGEGTDGYVRAIRMLASQLGLA